MVLHVLINVYKIGLPASDIFEFAVWCCIAFTADAVRCI